MIVKHTLSTRQFFTVAVKHRYRALRSRVLTIGLRPGESVTLSQSERQASAMMSIVVAVHDALEVTARCLNSLEKLAGTAEVIVVDDGSKLPGTRTMLNEICTRNVWKLIKQDEAVGHSRASEAGVAVSSRPFVCLLNSDTIVTPRSWAGVIQAFDQSPQIAVVGPSTSNTVGPQVVLRAYHCRYHWSDHQIWSFAEKYAARHREAALVEVPFVGGFAFFIRRTTWDELGGFDTKLPDYGNEMELCRRVLRAGYRIVWSQQSYIHHLGSESYGKTIGMAAIQERGQTSQSYINNKYGP